MLGIDDCSQRHLHLCLYFSRQFAKTSYFKEANRCIFEELIIYQIFKTSTSRFLLLKDLFRQLQSSNESLTSFS